MGGFFVPPPQGEVASASESEGVTGLAARGDDYDSSLEKHPRSPANDIVEF